MTSSWKVGLEIRLTVKIFYEGSPSVPHPPQFNSSVPHKRVTPFQPPKSPISTPKTPQFHTPFSSTLKPSVPDLKPLREKIALNKRCGTEKFLVWNWGVFGVELRGSVWNWGVLLYEEWCLRNCSWILISLVVYLLFRVFFAFDTFLPIASEVPHRALLASIQIILLINLILVFWY